MAWYPGANTSVRGTSPGGYTQGPWKILLHTTEGGSANGAFSAYRANGTWPHFTVDHGTVYQHLDTATAGSALRNLSGGVETNRSHAVQIEMVGYAGKAKDPAMLALVAAVCAWIADVHGVPYEWPSGRPMGSGGPHNRSVDNWNTRGGWYGHSQAPESDHWDPGYLSDDELAILMGEPMEPAHTFINGQDVTTTVRSWLADGNSVIDASEWCSYAGYPAPQWDNKWAGGDYAGALKISTQKVFCELLDAAGQACPNLSVALVAVPVEGAGETIRAWICADHLDRLALAAGVLESPPETPPPAQASEEAA